MGIVSGYGLTEAPIVVMATTEDPDQKLADTEGRPTPGVELIVVGLDGDRAGPGQEGEIRLKGPQVIRGYLDSLSTTRPSTTTGTSGAAISGSSTGTAT